MFFDEVWEHIEDNSNILMFGVNIYQLFSENRGGRPWAFVNNPRKGKQAIADIVLVLDPGRKVKTLSVAQLLDVLSSFASDSEERVVIWVDNFEKLNKRTLEYYEEIVCMKNVFLICNFKSGEDEFIYPQFFDDHTFVLLNSEEYATSRANSVNVKYTLLLLLSVFIFLLFLRVQLSMVGYLVTALWFTLLMYRSFYYITR